MQELILIIQFLNVAFFQYDYVHYFSVSLKKKMALRIEPGAEDIWSRLGVVTEALASEFYGGHEEQNGSIQVRLLFSKKFLKFEPRSSIL